MTIAAAVFDFDGTIADTQEVLLAIGNRLAGEFGYAPIAPEEVAELRDLGSREVLRRMAIPAVKIPFLLRRLRLELNAQATQLQPIPGIADALDDLRDRGYHLGIATSNLEANVCAFLHNHDLGDRFDFVHSGIALFGKDRILRRILRRQHLSANRVAYIGDETRDIEAARNSHVRAVSVSWGFNSASALARANPDALIAHPSQLAEALADLVPVR